MGVVSAIADTVSREIIENYFAANTAGAGMVKSGDSVIMPVNPKSLENLKPWTAETAPTAGRTTLGATVRQCLNALCGQGLTLVQLEAVADDESEPWARRVAARRMVLALDEGEDFDRVIDQTAGRPDMNVKIAKQDAAQMTDAEIVQALTDAGLPLPPGLSPDAEPKPPTAK